LVNNVAIVSWEW